MTPKRVVALATALLALGGSLATREQHASAQDASTVKISLTPATADAWITSKETMTFGALWTDFDRNGYPDLFINRHYQAPWFHQYAGDRHAYYRYTFDAQNGWAADDAFVDRHGCAWGEASGGGGPDLYCTQGANKGTGRGANQLFLATGARFEERAVRLGVHDPWGRGRAVNWIDYDNDTDLDLLVTNAARKGTRHRMFRNDRGSFQSVPVGLGRSGSEWPTSTYADWDNDGDFDVLMLDGILGVDAYLNDGGRFSPAVVTGIPDQEWVSATWGDYNGDGWIDLHLVGRTSAVVLKNVGGDFVIASTTELDFGRTSAWFDVDNDADLDLFVVQGTQPPAGAGNVNHPDFVLLNHAGVFDRLEGRSFRGPRTGNGDQVITGDYDRDGRVDLFVTNGHNPSEFTGTNVLLRNTTEGGNSAAIRLRGERWNPMGMGTRIHVQTALKSYWYAVTDGVTHRGQSEVDNVVLGLGGETSAFVTIHWASGEKDCFEVKAGTTTLADEGATDCDTLER